MWLCLLYILTALSVSGEVITLLNKENITCVLTNESVYSALYIWPPSSRHWRWIENEQRSITKINKWIYDDWNTTDSAELEDFSWLPIDDIKWEDSAQQIYYYWRRNGYHWFFKTSTQFSLCENQFRNISLRFYDSFISLTVEEPVSSSKKDCIWLHYIIKKNLLIKYRDDAFELTTITTNISIHHFDIRVNKYDDLSYIREYRDVFRIASETTKANRSTIDLSNISDSQNIRICMFVAITEDYFLDILTDAGKKIVNKTVVGFIEKRSKFLQWQKIEIEINNYNGTGRLIFFRRKLFDNSSYGFWALDFVHICRPKIDFYYKSLTGLDSENYTCRTLDRSNFNTDIFCKKKGYLGKHCNVSCTDVFGISNLFCKNYKICSENGTCQCAPGYQGSFCEEKQLLSFLERVGELNSFLLMYSMFTLLAIVILGFIFFRFKTKKFPFDVHQNQNVTKDIALTDRQNTNISVNNFEKYVKVLCSERNIFTEQFYSLQQADVKSSTKNVTKNKDPKNVSTLTRTIPRKLRTVGTDKYINASFLDGYNRPKNYIICRGPKFSTVCDFWRMIWQENVHTIVMATNFVENDQRMCAEYWNAGLNTIFECGDLNIRLTHEDIYEHYDSRTFEVFYTRDRRVIQHFQLKWNSTNEELLYPNDIAPVVKHVNEISQKSEAPILFHSGLRSNRSGMLILCDLALHMAQSEQQVDIFRLLKKMRDQRPNIIDGEEYYLLAHLIVLECLLEKENPFKKLLHDNLESSIIEEQVRFLDRMNEYDSAVTAWMSQNPTSDALRPIFVNGYQHPKKFIIMKQPTNKMISEFWHFIANEKIKYIVFVSPCKAKMFPYTTRNTSTVMKVSQIDSTHPTVSHTLDKVLQLIYDSGTKQVINENEISCLNFPSWEKTQSFYNIFEMMNDIKGGSQDKERVLVTFKNDIDGSCFVVTLLYLRRKYEKELETAEFFSKQSQLKYIYTALLEYIQNFDKYNHVDI